MVEPYNNAVLKKAHDVRNLRECHYCKGMGSKDQMIYTRSLLFWHGRCYAKRLGRKRFLALTNDELQSLTLDDIGGDLAKAVLEEIENRRYKPWNPSSGR